MRRWSRYRLQRTSKSTIIWTMAAAAVATTFTNLLVKTRMQLMHAKDCGARGPLSKISGRPTPRNWNIRIVRWTSSISFGPDHRIGNSGNHVKWQWAKIRRWHRCRRATQRYKQRNGKTIEIKSSRSHWKNSAKRRTTVSSFWFRRKRHNEWRRLIRTNDGTQRNWNYPQICTSIEISLNSTNSVRASHCNTLTQIPRLKSKRVATTTIMPTIENTAAMW